MRIFRSLLASPVVLVAALALSTLAFAQPNKIAKGGAQPVALKLTPAVPSPSGSVAPAVTTSASAAPPAVPSSAAPKRPIVSPGPSTALVVASGVLGTGGLAAAIGFTIAAYGKSADADALDAKLPGRSLCSGTPGPTFAKDCKTLKSTLTAQSTLSSAAMAGFVVGGAFALLAIRYGVWGSKIYATTGGIQITPVIGARDTGILVQGAW
jgi:hypothetical protein